jgi:signal transduction histidine kinase/CheY-like chemotaxis protein/integral membrane sensor domain MASE1
MLPIRVPKGLTGLWGSGSFWGRREGLIALAIAAAYIVASWISLNLALVGSVSLVWPASGLALWAALRWRWLGVAGVTLGNGLFVLWRSPWVPLRDGGLMAGIAVEMAILIVLLRPHVGPRPAVRLLSQSRQVVVLLGAIGLGTGLHGAIAGLGFGLTGMPTGQAFELFYHWWLSNGIGAITLGPALVLWGQGARGFLDRNPWRYGEFALALAIAVLLSWLSFGLRLPLEYLLIPVAVWAAFRYGDRAAASVVSIVTLGGCLALRLTGSATEIQVMDFVLAQSFLGCLALMVWALLAILAERETAAHRLSVANAALEDRIRTRTAELETAKCAAEQEVRERTRAQRTLSDRAALLEQHNRILADLSRDETLHQGKDLAEGLRHITEALCSTLAVARCGVWRCNEAEEEVGDDTNCTLEALDLFDQREQAHASGYTMTIADYPNYFAALAMGEMVATSSALCDPRTAEFAEDYLIPLDIQAMLDVPLKKRGKVFGVICLEHVGSERAWLPEELAFARSVGDLVTLAFEAHRRVLAEQAAQQARMAAEAASQAKSEFLANMSHELRTPLNGILGYAQILQRDRVDPGDRQRYAQVIRQCGDHLLSLIEDVLDLSKIEARRLDLTPEPVALRGCVEEVAHMCAVRAEQKGLAFELTLGPDLPDWVLVDGKRLRQVLLNLLGNAVKFTHRGAIALRVVRLAVDGVTPLESAAAGDGGADRAIAAVRFEVEDTGVGIGADQCQKIFDPFEQAGSSRQRSEGTGLGLAIGQRLVQRMGGAIAVDSEPGRGSRFWFDLRLPLTDMAADPAIEKDSRRAAIVGYRGDRRSILVVDDGEANRSVVMALLEPLGFDLRLAVNGREALEAAIAQPPDLILTDIAMPEMDGLTLIHHLRQEPTLAPVPIIVSSASVLEFDRAACLELGCQDFLPKPLDFAALLASLARHLALDWIEEAPPADGPAAAPPPAAALAHGSGGDRAAAFTFPPEAALVALREAVEWGDLQTVKAEAKRLQALDPTYGPFGDRLLALVRDFDDVGLEALMATAAGDRAIAPPPQP